MYYDITKSLLYTMKHSYIMRTHLVIYVHYLKVKNFYITLYLLFSYANASHFQDNLHNNCVASFISHKLCHLSARKTRTPRRTQISMRTGNALQKPKIYQNWSQSHSSITNIDREIAALE